MKRRQNEKNAENRGALFPIKALFLRQISWCQKFSSLQVITPEVKRQLPSSHIG